VPFYAYLRCEAGKISVTLYRRAKKEKDVVFFFSEQMPAHFFARFRDHVIEGGEEKESSAVYHSGDRGEKGLDAIFPVVNGGRGEKRGGDSLNIGEK